MANIIGTTGNNTLNGTANDDFIFGDAGNDTLNGNGGNDILVGGYSLDKMYGGAGNDEFWVGGTEIIAGEIIDGGTGTNTISTWGGDLSLATITNVQRLGFHLSTLKLKASQLAAFSDLVVYNATPVTLTAAGAGTYSLFGKKVTGIINITGSSGNDVLAGNGAAQTLIGGDGNDVLQGLGGADKMYGGNGDDEFLVGGDEVAAGEIIDGGAGNNKISTWGGDLSKATITNVQTLGMHLDKITLSPTQLDSFTTLIAYDGVPVTLQAASAGSYAFRLTYKNLIGNFNLKGTDEYDILIGNQGSQTIFGGGGDDYIDGLGGGDWVYGGDGNDFFGRSDGTNYTAGGISGANYLYGEAGDDYFDMYYQMFYFTAPTGGVIDGGSGNNTLQTFGDISKITISNIQNLSIIGYQSVTLTSEQFNVFTNIYAYGGGGYIVAANAGTYNLSNKNVTGILLGLAGSAGADILVGNAGNDTLTGNAGNDTLDGRAGADSLNGGIGNDTYVFRRGYGADTITDYDNTTGNTDAIKIPLDYIGKTADVTHDQLWFLQQGNDLLVQIIGTSDSFQIKNWYSGSANHVEYIIVNERLSGVNETAFYLQDTQVQNLVNAMAGLAPPSTTTLSAAYHTVLDPIIAASWTSSP